MPIWRRLEFEEKRDGASHGAFLTFLISLLKSRRNVPSTVIYILTILQSTSVHCEHMCAQHHYQITERSNMG